MGLPLTWGVVNHSSTNNDSDMNMKNILSLQRKMDMKLAFYIFLFVTAVVCDDDETEKPLLKCYVCSGVNNVCGDAADLGTETTCPRISETCIVATGDNGDITRMCGRKDEYVPKCVNDDTFCFCTGNLCNAGPGWSSLTTAASALLAVFVVLNF